MVFRACSPLEDASESLKGTTNQITARVSYWRKNSRYVTPCYKRKFCLHLVTFLLQCGLSSYRQRGGPSVFQCPSSMLMEGKFLASFLIMSSASPGLSNDGDQKKRSLSRWGMDILNSLTSSPKASEYRNL